MATKLLVCSRCFARKVALRHVGHPHLQQGPRRQLEAGCQLMWPSVCRAASCVTTAGGRASSSQSAATLRMIDAGTPERRAAQRTVVGAGKAGRAACWRHGFGPPTASLETNMFAYTSRQEVSGKLLEGRLQPMLMGEPFWPLSALAGATRVARSLRTCRKRSTDDSRGSALMNSCG